MIDLHVHSCRSDGTDSPRRLVELASDAGCEAIALTDHDTVAGLPEAQHAGVELGVEVIAGVELSAFLELDGRNDTHVHLLGYFMNVTDTKFLAFLKRQRDLRNERNQTLIDMLHNMDVALNIEDVKAESIGESVGRPHFAAALVRRGYVDSVAQAFSSYLGADAPTHVNRRDLAFEEAVDAIKSAGGLTSWAHPLTGGHRNLDEVASTLEVLVNMGLDGLECIYGSYSHEQRTDLVALAREHRAVPTGGSDYHGDFKPGLSVGSGNGNLNVSIEVLHELRALNS